MKIMKNPEKNQKSILTKKVRRLSSGGHALSMCEIHFLKTLQKPFVDNYKIR